MRSCPILRYTQVIHCCLYPHYLYSPLYHIMSHFPGKTTICDCNSTIFKTHSFFLWFPVISPLYPHHFFQTKPQLPPQTSPCHAFDLSHERCLWHLEVGSHGLASLAWMSHQGWQYLAIFKRMHRTYTLINQKYK